MNLKGNDFLKLLDYSPEQIDYLLQLAAKLKAEKKAGIPHRLCEGKNVALIFEKTSTRTRSSFEVAAHDLGMGSTYLDSTGSQIGKKESIADTARVLSGMFDGIEYRGYGQSIVEELAQYASVPVWNGLTDEFHPTQILADFLTIREHFGSLENIHLVYMGDARFNMGNSLMVGCAKMGMHFTACAPEGYFPDAQLIAECQAIAAQTGAVLDFLSDPAAAVQGANVVYTDIWVWASRNPSGPSASRRWRRIRSTRRSWPRPTPTPSSCTACRRITIKRPPSAARCARASAARPWRSRTTCLKARSRSCFRRPKTACTPSRRSWRRRLRRSSYEALSRT